RNEAVMFEPDPAAGWLALVLSLMLLNAAVTFHNIWPTPAVGWSGELSVELAVLLLLGVVISRTQPAARAHNRHALAVLWLMLAIGRYIDVTAPALWGRPINFYWDLQFVPDVAAMLAGAAKPWLVVAAGAMTLGLLAVAFVLLDRALAIVWRAY